MKFSFFKGFFLLRTKNYDNQEDNITSSPNLILSTTNSNVSLNQQQQVFGHSRKDSRVNDKFHQLFPTIPIYETVLQSEKLGGHVKN